MATTDRRTRSRTPGDPRKVVGYVRVSTGEQALGPEAQRTAMLSWCEAQGSKMVDVFCDHAVGGAAPADQRPGLSAALAGVKQHGAGILLVATRDRLARDSLVAALVEQRAQELGASIRSAGPRKPLRAWQRQRACPSDGSRGTSQRSIAASGDGEPFKVLGGKKGTGYVSTRKLVDSTSAGPGKT